MAERLAALFRRRMYFVTIEGVILVGVAGAAVPDPVLRKLLGALLAEADRHRSRSESSLDV